MESSPDLLTEESRFFLEPASPAQRQYEALRAYFLEGSPSQQVAERFGYSPGSFRVLCHHFRRAKPTFSRTSSQAPAPSPRRAPPATSFWLCANRISPSMTLSARSRITTHPSVAPPSGRFCALKALLACLGEKIRIVPIPTALPPPPWPIGASSPCSRESSKPRSAASFCSFLFWCVATFPS